jgi:hypothetical protein
MLGFGGAANGQVVSLLVGNQSGFDGIDRYSIVDGSYQGVFAGPATSGGGYNFLTYGPDNNLYVGTISSIPNQVFKFNGMTGSPLGTFISTEGGNFTFGTNGDFFRITDGSTVVSRYNGTTGQLIGPFATGLQGAGAIHFGPGGDLFVNSLNSIRRFNGTTGALIGDFVTSGSGGLTGVLDFVFTPGNKLLVSGGSGGPNDKILEYDGTTGAFVGIFAQGNGLSLPRGMALAGDGNLYVVSGGFSSSILRFDSSNGTFLGSFVANPAHPEPYHLAITPFPVPEPTAFVFTGLVGLCAALVRRRLPTRRLSRSSLVADFGLSKTTDLQEC